MYGFADTISQYFMDHFADKFVMGVRGYFEHFPKIFKALRGTYMFSSTRKRNCFGFVSNHPTIQC